MHFLYFLCLYFNSVEFVCSIRYQVLKKAASLYGPSLFLGERVPIKNEKGELVGFTNFRYFTFADVRMRV